MIRKVFFGSNTANGFCSYYDFLRDDGKIFILKGGPGHGKSTFIKSIADKMIEKGYDVELQFCSLDCNSLDAIVVPSLNLAVVATTGHHVMDPKYPGVVDNIVDLGAYLNVNGLLQHKQTIISLYNDIEKSFRRTYRYLTAARLMAENIKDINSTQQNTAAVNGVMKEIIENAIPSSTDGTPGYERHLFASSITPQGYLTHIKTLIDGIRVYKITGDWGTGKTTIMKKIGEEAKIRGFNVEYYHHPLDPDDIEHLILPDVDAAIVTRENIANDECEAVYNLNDNLKKNNHIPEEDKMNELIIGSMENLHRANKLHHELENYYTPHLNFEGVNKRLDEVIIEINQWETASKEGLRC